MRLERVIPKKDRPYRRPQRTTSELADDLGIDFALLGRYISWYKGPEPSLVNRATKWYDPVAVRKWWQTLPIEVRGRS
jgi:hypothetical protein